MITFNKKIEGSLYISSLLETIGYFNSKWEFNYGNKIDTIKEGVIMNYFFVNQFQMTGGIKNFNLSTLKSSDDTILLIATTEAVLNGGGEKNYISSYLKYYSALKDEIRQSGQITLVSLEKIRIHKNINAIEYNSSHGGNGCAIRTGPIGLMYYKNIDKVCEEALIASLVTHNYPVGYLGGIVSALFTAYAMLNINPFLWSLKLIDLYKDKYFNRLISKYDINNRDKEITDYFIYWEKYNENRLTKMKYRNLPIFINPVDKIKDYTNYTPVQYLTKMRGYEKMGSSGLEAPIIAYDNLLLSAIPDDNLFININSPKFDWELFMYNNIYFFGDNDSISAISGFWFGAYLGVDDFPINQIRKLEFYNKLNKLINDFKKFKKNI
jgi:ADP-ribosylglycohydrolase